MPIPMMRVRETYDTPVPNGGYLNEMELVSKRSPKNEGPSILTEFGFWDMSSRSKEERPSTFLENLKATYQSLK